MYIYIYVIYTYMYKYTMRQNILPDGLPNKYTRKALETIGELVYLTRVDICIYIYITQAGWVKLNQIIDGRQSYAATLSI